ncbi:hypothetical protein EGW08_007519 [Elysia chlorotica]|uniref:Uncharacterized protein n=1 Tax=Elysia chlorotica TaxID=188477 RepID=A0A433TT24_ELYCH|nr:hypothetical protein EGW08_007519 [Elysia chlorotica]
MLSLVVSLVSSTLHYTIALTSSMVATIHSCGYDGFKQISGFRQASLDDWGTISEGNSVSKCDDTQAVSCPFAWLRLHENVKVRNAVFTWSHNAIFLTKDGATVSVIVGHLNPESPTAATVNGEVVCATESHFLLKKNDGTEPALKFESMCVKELQRHPLSVKEDHDRAIQSDLDVYASHNDLYYSRGSVEFGRLTTEDGGKGVNFPRVICPHPLDMSLRIDRITCGKEHVLLLSHFGCVYSFGLGSRGQLGHGDVEMERTPRLIEALEGVKMVGIQAGGWHSLSVSESGDVYAWGWNESGQLGISSVGPGSNDRVSPGVLITEPECVTLPSEDPIKAAACGSRHTLLLSECGQVFASGWNRYGQLGLGHTRDQRTFVKVPSITSSCRQIFAGHWCSIFICND